MPQKRTVERARRAKRRGKAATTQAGEFVREEIDDIRRGKHGARSAKQAIAIGLSKARRAGVDLPPPAKGKAKKSTRKSAAYAYDVGQGKRKAKRQPRIAKAVSKRMKKEPRNTVSHEALSRQAKQAASKRKRGSKKAVARRPAPKAARRPQTVRRTQSAKHTRKQAGRRTGSR